MGKGPDRKIQKAKARQEAIRKQKAQTAAQPRLLREHPGLGAALSTRHPLVGYFVNAGWTQARMANVVVIREAETGQIFATFLVDTMWRGLKDCFGNYGLADALAELASHRQLGQPALVPLDPALAVTLIRGGLAWAQRFRYPLPANYEMWLRLVDPAPAGGLDLRLFGENGTRPIILGTPEEVLKFEGGRGGRLELIEAPAEDDGADDDEDAGEDDAAPADDDPPPDKPRGLLRFLRR